VSTTSRLSGPAITISDTGAGSSSTVGTSLSCTYGGTSAPGDLIILGANMGQASGTTTYTSPGGWTTVSSDGATSAAFHSASYLLNGSSPTTVTATAGTSQNNYATAGVAFQGPSLVARPVFLRQAVNRASTY
jgi:hypothetical protein